MKPPILDAQPISVGYFCPACGSASVTTQPLVGTGACELCPWKGRIEELAAFPFSQDLGSPEDVSRAFFLDARQLLGQHLATPLARFLVKWGFVDEPTPRTAARLKRELAQYVGACASALVKTIIEVRQRLEKERHEQHGN